MLLISIGIEVYLFIQFPFNFLLTSIADSYQRFVFKIYKWTTLQYKNDKLILFILLLISDLCEIYLQQVLQEYYNF